MANTYFVGQTVTVTNTVTVGGVLTNASVMSLTYRDPSGVDTTVTPTNASTGLYSYPITVTLAGIYQLRWVGTGTAAGAYQDFFTVAPLNT